MDWDTSDIPDPQDPQTFYGSKLDWDEVEQGDHARLLEVYRELLELRRTVPAFTDPRFDAGHARSDDDDRWLLLTRDDVVTVVNFGDAATEVELDHPADQTLFLVGEVAVDGPTVRLGPRSALVAAVDLPNLPASFTPGG